MNLFCSRPKYYQLRDEDSGARHEEADDSSDGAVDLDDSSDGAARKVPAGGEEAQLGDRFQKKEESRLKRLECQLYLKTDNLFPTFASILTPMFRQERRGTVEG